MGLDAKSGKVAWTAVKAKPGTARCSAAVVGDRIYYYGGGTWGSLYVLDLSTGGTGWGVCPEGMDACESSYFAGPELIALLAVALFVGVALIAACARGLRALRRRSPVRSA